MVRRLVASTTEMTGALGRHGTTLAVTVVAAGVLAWCALAQLANVVSGPSATLMYLTGQAESLLRIGVVSVVSACAAAWILGESYGVVGAAAGYAIGFWVRAGLQVERIGRA